MNILVVLEHSGNGLRRSSYEALTAARILGGTVTGVIIGGTEAQIASAGAYGLTSCLNITSAGLESFANGRAAAAIAEAARKVGATYVLLSATSTGKDLAPRIAVRLEAGLLADCVELHADGSAVRPVYAGKALVTVRSTTSTTVLTLRPNVFTARLAETATTPTIETFSPSVADIRSSVVTNIVRNEGTVDVAEADIVVSGGRGLKGPEHFTLVENLAKALGAAVGASRAVVDAGWRPHREQVGQTGKTVSPSMYVACGISGAVQHLAGMSSSRIIVAVNKDKEAPIFKVADYGIVGDVFDVLPKLTEKIAGVTGKH